MLISDLLPFLYQNQLPMPLGGPAAALLPKSANNATGGNIPGVRTPPLSSPTDMMNAGTQAQNVQSEIKLRDFQAQQLAAQVGLLKSAAEPAPPMYLDGASGGGASYFGALSSRDLPAAPGGGGGWGPHADTAISTLKDAGASEAFIQGALANGLAEGGFAEPWKKAGGGENSFGHWQYNAKGELPRYNAWVEQVGGDPKETAMQARYLAYRMKQIAPHILSTDDPKAATDIIATQFERYKNAAPGQRYGYLADAQKAMAGGTLEPRQPISDVPGFTSAFGGNAGSAPTRGGLPPVPDFAGMMNGNQGPAYAPQMPPPGAPSNASPPWQPGNLAQYTQPGDKGGSVTVGGVTYPTVSAWNRAMDAKATATAGWAAQPPTQLAQNGPLSSLPTTQAPPMPMGAPSPAAVAPRMMPGGAPAFGPMPPQMPQQGGGTTAGLPRLNPQYLGWALQRDQINAALGRRNPTALEETLKMALSNSPQFQAAVEAAKKNATAPIDLAYAGPMASAQAWGKAPAEIYAAWNKPVNARPGGAVVDPSTGRMVGAVPTLQKTVDPTTGQERWEYMSPMSAQNGGSGPNGAGGSPGVAGLGPGERQSLVTRAEKEQADRQMVINEANAAQQSRATLMSMSNDAGSFVQGPFAAHAQSAARYLRLIDSRFDGQVASYEDFVKNAGQLTRQAVKDVSSRAAVQEFNLIGNSLPQPETSPLGLQKVQNELIGLTDYKLAKAQAQQQWESTHGGIGNVSGFETAFQRQASPYAFVVARMDGTDRQQMFAKLQGSAQGRQELARLGQQLQFLKQSGLAQ